MSKQQFSTIERQAIWEAHARKCAYTGELIDPLSMHIDHIVPESLADKPAEFEKIRSEYGLPADFDLKGHTNLLPVKPGPNLRKGDELMPPTQMHYFLGIAHGKAKRIAQVIAEETEWQNKAKAIVVLKRLLESGKVTEDEVDKLLDDHRNSPNLVFELATALKLANEDEITQIKKSEISELRDKPVWLRGNDHLQGAELRNEKDETRTVRTCHEYEQARADGFFAYSTFEITIATFFVHDCGLLNALTKATKPSRSFVASPRVGVADLDLLPESMFPNPARRIDEKPNTANEQSYQDLVSAGTLVVEVVKQNRLVVNDSGMMQLLIEVARADFTGEGLEQLLVLEYSRSMVGTLRWGTVLILSRTSKDARFTIAQQL